MMNKVSQTTIDKLAFDNRNANKGTARGRGMLENSLSELGAGRSILLDKHGQIIAGNKTAEVAHETGVKDVIIVHTNGKQLVAVQRDDLDLNERTGKARKLAYADNRVGQVSLEFDPVVVALDLEAGLDLSQLFYESELNQLMLSAGDTLDHPPDFEDKGKQCQCPNCGHTFRT